MFAYLLAHKHSLHVEWKEDGSEWERGRMWENKLHKERRTRKIDKVKNVSANTFVVLRSCISLHV